jgi:acetoin:2,6-dichlorophenolindophenol oxidoreductase subunit alpha
LNTNPNITNELLIKMYSTMQTIRLFEKEVLKMNALGFLPGFIHSYVGEEASATGSCLNLRPDDYIVSNHRGHGHVIAKGCEIDRMMAELFGKKDGYCKGKGGSMHIADFSLGIIGANGIVGAGLPIATGAGLAAKLENKGKVAMCFFGDGASNHGTFHESLNLASIWNLPVIFICENNQYAVSTSQKYHQKIENISERASSYKMFGATVDGNDVIEVYNSVFEAVKRARDGEGPSLVETKTYRWYGHCEADPPDIYRTREEVCEWKDKDPIIRFEKYLIEKNVLGIEKIEFIKGEIVKKVDDAVEFAKNSPEPELESALEDLFYERSN